MNYPEAHAATVTRFRDADVEATIAPRLAELHAQVMSPGMRLMLAHIAAAQADHDWQAAHPLLRVPDYELREEVLTGV